MMLAKSIFMVILDIFFYVKRIQKNIYKEKIESNIRVLIYHDFKSDHEIKNFKNQILSLKKNMNLLHLMNLKKA